MRTRLIAAGVLSLSLLAGCGQPRALGRCAVGGAIVGGVVGSAAGAVIGNRTNHDSGAGPAVAGGFLGLATGGLLGGVAGHFICDPYLTPPPPPAPPPPPQSVAQVPPPLPPPSPPPPPAAKEKLVLRGVHFDSNKADIRPEDEPVLDEAAENLKQNANVVVDVNGYCDAAGADEYNQKLSERRAASVARYLSDKGVPSDHLVPHGFGKTNFVATNDTDEGRAQNRRVELIPE
jgi:OOP family OmpA-OmpF porin